MTFFYDTVYWGTLISIGSYLFGMILQKKTKLIIFNPLLLSTLVIVVFLLISNTDYEMYYNSAECIHYLLTPATVCLAIPLYEKISILKSNLTAILIGISSGVLSSLLSILLFSILFGFSHELYITLLPKSVTAAMGMGISDELGGISSLTVPIIIMTGITGNIIADKVCKIFKITDPIAKGVAIGTSSHAMGTAKALEMGDIEGAMSSLSIAVTGVFTVFGAAIFQYFY